MANNKTKNKDKPIKITWEYIYSDFKKLYPNLSKDVVDYRPYDYATIILFLNDGVKLIYNYDEKKAYFLKDN